MADKVKVKQEQPKIKKPGTKKRGGARPGSGPKKQGPKHYSDALKIAVKKHLDMKEQEGESYGKLLVDLAYDPKAFHSLRGIALKLIADILVVKESKKTVEEIKKPTIYIPEYKKEDAQEEQAQQGLH